MGATIAPRTTLSPKLSQPPHSGAGLRWQIAREYSPETPPAALAPVPRRAGTLFLPPLCLTLLAQTLPLLSLPWETWVSSRGHLEALESVVRLSGRPASARLVTYPMLARALSSSAPAPLGAALRLAALCAQSAQNKGAKSIQTLTWNLYTLSEGCVAASWSWRGPSCIPGR